MSRSAHKIPGRLSTWTLALGTTLVAFFVTGCPTYEDEYSGHFRETLSADRTTCFERRNCNAIAVDFFRFGDYAQAIVREYAWGIRNTADQPFVEETRCIWTQADRFDPEDRTFNLPFKQGSTEPSVIRGTLDEDGLLLSVEVLEPSAVVTVDSEQTNGVLGLDLSLLENESPRSDCDTINDFVLNARLSESVRISEQSGYAIANPVFALVWLGFERLDTPGGVVFVPTRSAPQPWQRLIGSTDGRSLSGRVLAQISPPEEKYLTGSGDTRFGLAHLIVVDDAQDSGRFSWDTTEEPIVGTAFGDGLPEGIDFRADSPRSGRALLFVEGELGELDPTTRSLFSNDIDTYPYADLHYYIVDIIADGDEVVQITLPETRSPERPVIRATEAYIESMSFDLPRIFPVSSQ